MGAMAAVEGVVSIAKASGRAGVIALPTRSVIFAGLRVSVKFPPPLVSDVSPPSVKVLLSVVVSFWAEVSRLGPPLFG